MLVNTLADSGYIYAVLDKADKNHTASARVLALSNQRVYLPTVTIPEVAFLVRQNLGSLAVAAAIRALRQPPWNWLDAQVSDYDRAAEIIETYKTSKLDIVDAVIVAMAERLNITRVLTIDRRDFSIIRPKHCTAFELLP